MSLGMATRRAALATGGDTDDVLGRARSHAIEPERTFVRKLVQTDRALAPAIARVALGAVMLPHGMQKLFGWFGGHGLAATYGFFTTQLGIPGPLAALAIALEIVAPLALLLGAFTRAAALGIIAVMVGAIVVVHLPHGFFMNWEGAKAGEGFEYHLLAIALGLACVIAGGGRASVDRVLMRSLVSPN
jgi:putative oxidoreductase